MSSYADSNSVAYPPQHRRRPYTGKPRRTRLTSFLLCLFFGTFGAHRFYCGKILSGAFWLVTGGVGGFGTFADMILLALNHFRDIDGYPLANNIPSWACWLLLAVRSVLAAFVSRFALSILYPLFR